MMRSYWWVVLDEHGQTHDRLPPQVLLLSNTALSKVQLVNSCLHPSLMHLAS